MYQMRSLFFDLYEVQFYRNLQVKEYIRKAKAWRNEKDPTRHSQNVYSSQHLLGGFV